MITVLPRAQRTAQWGLRNFRLPFFPCLWPKNTCFFMVQVKIWDIPVSGLQENLTKARTTLIGHTRRVGLIEWHPTAENLLLSSAYDYNVRHCKDHWQLNWMNWKNVGQELCSRFLLSQVLLWDVSQNGAVLRCPVQVVLRPVYHRYPSETLLLSVSFNSDGSRLAVTSMDRRVRVLDPRTGKILQVRFCWGVFRFYGIISM